MLGGPNNDLLNGSDGADTILGLKGQDTIAGFSAGDSLNGNQDNDTVLGGTGDDVIHGGQGGDSLRGEEGSDRIWGDLGSDVLYGGKGDDSLFGGVSSLSPVRDSGGRDLLFGGEGSDFLNGNENADTLDGADGADTVRGGRGADIINGGLGNDVLYGDKGADTLRGGEGADIFVLGTNSGGPLLSDADTVEDFNPGTDFIGLTGGQSFSNLEVSAGTGEFSGATVIRDLTTNDYLAIILGVSSTALTGDRFTTNLEAIATTGTDGNAPLGTEIDKGNSGNSGLSGPFPELQAIAAVPTVLPATPAPELPASPELPPTDVINTAPTDITLSSSSVSENSASDTVVGDLSATDADAGDSHTYSLTDDAEGRFKVVGSQLQVANGTLLDFETYTSHQITLRATDSGGLTFDKTLTINVGSVNEAAPTDIALSANSVSENSASDTVVGDLSATDADAGDSHTYSLIDDAGGRFKIVGEQLQVADGTLLDFEANTSHQITLRAIDSGSLTFDKTLTINVSDVNEEPTDIALSSSSVSENSASDTVVGDLSATDPDAEDSHTYSLTDDAGGRFKIVGEQLQVADGILLDFETSTSHQITMRATDSGGLTFDKTLTIDVGDLIDEPPTDITLSANSVLENSANDTVVGDLSATDADAGDSHTYSLTDDAGGRFKLVGSQLQVANGTLLDFETNTSHQITMRATDSGGLTFDKALTIDVGGVNEAAPTDIALSANSVLENSANDTVVGDLSATDADAGDSHTYSLTDDAGGRFKLVGSQLQVANGTLLDFETNTSHQITVRATDSGGLTFDKTLTINVSDVNDPPVATDNSITEQVLLSSRLEIPVADLLANDSDQDGDSLSITAVSNPVNGKVSLSGTTVTFQANPGFSGAASFEYTVSDGNGGTDTGKVDINHVLVSQLQLSAVASQTGLPVGAGGFAIDGEAADDRSGYSVSTAGDVNGDGLADLIVGARFADPNGTSSGRSYVVFGKTDGATVNSSAVTAGTGGFAIDGEATGDESGYSVSAAGDVNGDGLADLIVGARLADVSNSGRSYVVFGKTTTTTVNLTNDVVNGTGGFAIDGEATNDQAGVSVSAAGDVNGDGLADLIVGAYLADPNVSESGRSYVVFGKTTTTTVNLSDVTAGTGGFAIDGEAASDRSGRSVSAAGDVNGDGLADLIVGASEADPNGSFSGRSYVLFGKTSGATVNLSDVTAGTGGFAIDGEAAFDFSSRSVSTAGDVNGDGFADLIVGARLADPNGSNSGRSYVVFGGDFTAAVTDLGTDGADVLTGVANGDALVGGAGNDTLSDGGFNDVLLYGGAGDDLLQIASTGFNRLNGGLGSDTLALNGTGITLDLTASDADNTKIAGIETIDLTGSGNNSLTLDYPSLLHLVAETTASSGFRVLTVTGDAGDAVTVSLSGLSFYSSSSGGFTTYEKDNLRLVVSDSVSQSITI